MKKITTLGRVISLIPVVVAALLINSCNKDNSNEINTCEQDGYVPLSGVWSFMLFPEESYHLEDTVHGYTAGDFMESHSEYQDIYLYEDDKGEISGKLTGYKIGGTRNGKSVHLELYGYPDGYIDEGLEIEDMVPFSKMDLSIDKFGKMTGSGDYYEIEGQAWSTVDTYSVEAVKTADITPPSDENLSFDLCSVASIFGSLAISYLTDGIFRPIATCWGNKVGGGYYVFGHEGPGSIIPVYTQTIYFPWEWSVCNVRKYDFDIDMKGECLTFELLKTKIRSSEKKYHTVEKLSFESMEDFESKMTDFKNIHGPFAVSLAYNHLTHTTIIYVNYDSGDEKSVLNHPFVQTIKNGVEQSTGEVYIEAGKKIKDSFLLKRSVTGLCNTPLVFFYLFGTNKVEYN